ncbi:MAG: hypothetical protein PHR51_02710 [Patescibacteria group bacterium]|nr:hypothetical protein [Patescibacteria group bacterium]
MMGDEGTGAPLMLWANMSEPEVMSAPPRARPVMIGVATVLVLPEVQESAPLGFRKFFQEYFLPSWLGQQAYVWARVGDAALAKFGPGRAPAHPEAVAQYGEDGEERNVIQWLVDLYRRDPSRVTILGWFS